MSAPEEEQPSLSVQNSGAVVQNGNLTQSGSIVAGRDVTIGTMHVLTDDGPPFGDLVTRPGETTDVCPYPGLDSFDARSAEYFHGRSRDVAKMLELLRRASLVALIGSSGSGKSSLLSAGVVPALARGELPGSANWVVMHLRPGTQPIDQLADAIAEQLPDATLAEVASAIQSDPAEFAAYDVQVQLVRGAPTIWVIDQLEEIFHPAVEEAVRTAFLAAVSGVLRTTGHKIVLALRSDFYPHLEREPSLATAAATVQHRLVPLEEHEIRDVVEKPAEQVHLRVEPELVDQILVDVGSAESVLPLLSYALEQTWRKRRNGWLTLAAYTNAGRLNGAIDRAATTVWRALTDREQATARRVMLRLSYLGEGSAPVRRRTSFADLVTDADDAATVTEVVNQLATARIVTVDTDLHTGDPTVEITHEAVLRAWGLLVTWLKEDREAKRAQEDLSSGALMWQKHDNDPSYLLQGARLATVEGARRTGGLTLNALELRYLARSKRAESQRRLRSRFVALLAAGFAVAVVISVVVVAQQRRIAAQKTVADALQLAAQSRSVVQQERDLGALLAVAGTHTHDDPVTRGAVIDATASRTGPLAYLLPADVQATTVADTFTANGSAIVGTADGALRILDPGDGHDTAPALTGHQIDVTAVDSAGDLVVSADATGTVLLHRIGTTAPMYPPVATASSHSRVTTIAISKRYNQVLAATALGTIERWQIDGRLAPLRALPRSTGVIDLTIDESTDQVIAVTGNGGLQRWRLSTGQQLPDLAAEGALGTGGSKSLDVAAPGQLVAVANNHLGVWDLHTGRRTAWADAPAGTAVTSLPDARGAYVGTSGGAITPWLIETTPIATGPVRYGLTAPVTALAAGSSYLVGVEDHGRVLSWDLTGRRSPAAHPVIELPDGVAAAAIGPDGVIVSAGAHGTLRLTRGRTTSAPLSLNAPVNRLAWTPSGSIVAGTADGRVLEVNVATSQMRTLASRAKTSIVALAVDNDGIVAAIFSDGQVFLSNRQGAPLPAAEAPATSGAWSADGKSLAIASWDGNNDHPPTITVRRADDGFRGAQTLTGHTLPVNSLAFSPDGKFLASGSDDTTIRIWSLTKGATIAELRGHSDMVLGLAYTPDGQTLASASQDGTVRLWDTQRHLQIGQPLRYVDDHEFLSMSASPDGNNLVATDGESAIEWPFAAQSWTTQACQLARREITPTEWTTLGQQGSPPHLCS